MPLSFNMARAGKLLCNAGTSRVLVIKVGTSQFDEAAWQFGDWALQRAMSPNLSPQVGIIGSAVSTGASVASWGFFFSNAQIVRTGLGGLDSDTQYDANTPACVVQPVTRLTFTADLADGAALGNGITINGRNESAGVSQNYEGQRSVETGKQWFLRTDGNTLGLQSKVLCLDTPGAMPFKFYTQVIEQVSGAGSVNNGTYEFFTPTKFNSDGSDCFASSPWSTRIAPASYAAYAGAEIRSRIEAWNGNEASANAHMTFFGNSVRLVRADGSVPNGLVLCTMGRSGSDTLERLNSASILAKASALRAIMANDRFDAVVFIRDGEHNAANAHLTSNVFNQTFENDVARECAELHQAVQTAAPGMESHVINVVMWPYTASANGMDTVAKCRSCEDRVYAASQRVGNTAMISLTGHMNDVAPFANNLHGGTTAATSYNVMAAASLFWQEVAAGAREWDRWVGRQTRPRR
jgi:hypothetical protein